jgi:O-antigen ligase
LFAILIIREQKGWSVGKRIRTILFLSFVSLLFLSIVPAANLLRATSFETAQTAAGGESLSNRVHTVVAAFEMIASNPILGIGIGNFRWMHQISYGRDLHPHNSYVGALLNGGISSLALYLLLFFVTYRMLKKLEDTGPVEFLWISTGLRVNLLIFMIFSISDDVWLSDFLYLMVGLTVIMTRLWQSQSQELTPQSAYFEFSRS